MSVRVLRLLAASLLPTAVSAQSLDLTIDHTGLSIGDSRFVRTGRRIGGFGAGAGGDVTGIQIGGFGVGAGGRVTGISIGGFGAGAGGDLKGLTIGGFGAGSGGTLEGLVIGGLGAGAPRIRAIV